MFNDENVKLIDLIALKNFKEQLGLPKITPEDEGKLLKVVEGKWATDELLIDSELSSESYYRRI